MRVGFVGLGRMGYEIAANLKNAGHDLRAYDTDAARLSDLRREGFGTASSVSEVADAADVCFLCLPDERSVLEVTLGERGIVSCASPPEILVDCTTSLPATTGVVAAWMAAIGTAVVDAPVSGGIKGARQGRLTTMVGGGSDAVAQVLPLLEAFSASVVVVGGSGTGHLCKLVNNGLSALSLAATAEVVMLGAALGCERGSVLEAVNRSDGRSQNSEVKFPDYVLPRTFDFGFALGLMVKDLTLLGAVLRSGASATPMHDLVRELYRLAAAQLPEGSDLTRYAEVVDGWGPTASRAETGTTGTTGTAVGAGRVEDLCNVLAGVLEAGTSEALTLLDGFDIELDQVLAALNSGSGRNETTRALQRGGGRLPAGWEAFPSAGRSWQRIEDDRRGIPVGTPLLSVGMAAPSAHPAALETRS